MQQCRTFVKSSIILKQNVAYVQNDLKQDFILSDSARIIKIYIIIQFEWSRDVNVIIKNEDCLIILTSLLWSVLGACLESVRYNSKFAPRSV